MAVDLAGRKALVTGATHGIGRGVVEYFVAAGANVVFSGRDLAAGDAVVQQLKAGRAGVTFLPGDLSVESTPAQLVGEAVTVLGGLDILVNAAGVYPQVPLAQLSMDTWNQVLRLNLTASFQLVQAAASALATSGAGRVVLISSITGPRTGIAGLSHYGASKAALEGFMRSAAVELAPQGITVNAVAPGTIWTPSLSVLFGEGDLETLQRIIPVGRIGNVEEVGAAVAFLCSTDASFITGQSLIVDGGQTLPEIQ